MLTKILVALISVTLGSLLVIKTKTFYDFFGTMDWAQHYLGAGGSRLMYKIIGILMILFGFMYLTGLWTVFLDATLGSLFNRPV